MKNKSWQHPFPTFFDKIFDKNKDGKLNTTETIFRDAFLNDINRKRKDDKNKKQWYKTAVLFVI